MSRILQFGTGRFLRGFFDCIVPEREAITVLQSRINSTGAATINEQSAGYHVWVRGKQQGQVVDRAEFVTSLKKGLDTNRQWREVLEAGTHPDLNLIISNTTEAGLSLDSKDRFIDGLNQCPQSYPAKLLAILQSRFQAGLNGVTILPMELIEFNADRLNSLVKEQALHQGHVMGDEFTQWLDSNNRWLNNLVDRIVVGVSESPPWDGEDHLAVVAEPYRLLAIQDDGGDRRVLPNHSMIQWTDDLQPLFLRKVRILNGLHTAMVARCLPKGFETVLEVVNHSGERAWLEDLLKTEILPTLETQGLNEQAFAADVLERFENPFFRHRLADIGNGHTQKMATRIQPTMEEYQRAFGKPPRLLSELVC